MKKVLIFTNLFLACIVVILTISNLTEKAQSQISGVERQRRSRVAEDDVSTGGADSSAGEAVVLPQADEALATIIAEDVFNPIRSPLANTRIGRADMTLVGVIEGRAAIIKNNTRQQQFNPYLAQAQRMAAAMGGSQGGQGGAPRFTQWSQLSGRRNNGPAQQYVRVGQTLSNGYTLTSVTRSRAVFERGNDKLELDLQLPSRNRAAARPQQRLSAAQQFQQAQMFMQSQMIRTMRDIQQQSTRQNAPATGRGRR